MICPGCPFERLLANGKEWTSILDDEHVCNVDTYLTTSR